jgi:beta-N-acetylhexosaminidase
VAALQPRLGQLLLVGFRGTTADDNPELTVLLCEAKVGGILLFGRNIADRAQVRRLTSAIRAEAARCGAPVPIIGVDAEGGRVMRLAPAAGYTETLSAEDLGRANDLTLTELEGGRVGRMLRDAGIDWDLAPVVDVGYNPANPVIVGVGRSFGANPALVTAHARAFIRGLHAAGVLSALKHFPGHGSSYGDSHLGFVDVTDTADPEVELAPYRALIAEHLADSVMTAHVFNRRLDRRRPATLSRATVTGLLRGELGYDGLVVSDDLRMGAIEQHYGLADAAVEALAAGVDFLLVADDRLPDGGSATRVALGAIERALATGALDADRVASALERVATFKARAAPPQPGAAR